MSEITKEEARQFIHIRDKYHPIQKIGTGTFSTVYKAIDIRKSTTDTKYVALKNITRTSAPNRVADELRFLKMLNGHDNILKLISCNRFEDQIIAVTPYFEYTEFRDLLADINLLDIRHYMHDLLKALAFTHEKEIIHRDIKPSNFLYSKDIKKGVLIDFGLAQLAKKREEKTEKKKNSVLFFSNSLSRATKPPGYFVGDGRPPMRAPRAGTRGFRAPEVLFKVNEQTTKVDVWSAGVTLLILLTKQYPFFNSQDDIDALVEIGTIFGHNEMKKAAKHYGRIWRSNINTVPNEKVSFEEIIEKLGGIVDKNAIDLLEMMLDLYSERRITAKAALDHPFVKLIGDI
ncbi:Cell division control protein 7 [Conglomerata obtusa]